MNMIDIKDKYRTLVELLFKKTQSGSLLWDYDGFSEELMTSVAKRQIVVTQAVNTNREPLIRVEIRNPQKSKVEIFTDESLEGATPSIGAFETYYVLMDALRNNAIRAATGADEDVDAILEELDDEIPF